MAELCPSRRCSPWNRTFAVKATRPIEKMGFGDFCSHGMWNQFSIRDVIEFAEKLTQKVVVE